MTDTATATLVLVFREWLRFYRSRPRVIATLATPLVFWLFLGYGLSAAFSDPKMPGSRGFVEYFFPGVVLLTALFTAIYSTISIIEDRHEGLLQSVLVAPISPSAIVGGKVFGAAMLCTGQSVLLLLFAPWAGFHLTVDSLLSVILTIFVLGLALSTLGFLFAWTLDSVQGFHGIMNLVLFPMWLLSGAFFPKQSAAEWLQPIMAINPLYYGLELLKRELYQGNTEFVTGISPWIGWVFLGVFFVLGFGASCWLVRRKP